MKDEHRDRFLTVWWNNALVAGLGLPILAFGAAALVNSSASGRGSFIWLVLTGVVY